MAVACVTSEKVIAFPVENFYFSNVRGLRRAWRATALFPVLFTEDLSKASERPAFAKATARQSSLWGE